MSALLLIRVRAFMCIKISKLKTWFSDTCMSRGCDMYIYQQNDTWQFGKMWKVQDLNLLEAAIKMQQTLTGIKLSLLFVKSLQSPGKFHANSREDITFHSSGSSQSAFLGLNVPTSRCNPAYMNSMHIIGIFYFTVYNWLKLGNSRIRIISQIVFPFEW